MAKKCAATSVRCAGRAGWASCATVASESARNTASAASHAGPEPHRPVSR